MRFSVTSIALLTALLASGCDRGSPEANVANVANIAEEREPAKPAALPNDAQGFVTALATGDLYELESSRMALQRQTSLLGLDKAPAVHAPAGADPAAPPPTAGSPPSPTSPLPMPADKASISVQAREHLGAGFDPRRGGADAGRGTPL